MPCVQVTAALVESGWHPAPSSRYSHKDEAARLDSLSAASSCPFVLVEWAGGRGGTGVPAEEVSMSVGLAPSSPHASPHVG